MTTHSSIRLFISVSGLALALPAMASWSDPFDKDYIAPARWAGESNTPIRGSHVEMQRSIINGQLRMRSKGFADNDSDTGATTVRNSMVMKPAGGPINGMQAKVSVSVAVVTGCEANETPSVTRTRLFGYYFNTGSSRSGSNYNDVFAGVQVYRASDSTDPADLLRISGFVGQCLNDDCTQTKALASQAMGTVLKGQAIELSADWSKDSHMFVLGRHLWGAPENWDIYNVHYDVADQALSNIPAKRLEISNQIAHCATPVRAVAHSAADFDDAVAR